MRYWGGIICDDFFSSRISYNTCDQKAELAAIAGTITSVSIYSEGPCGPVTLGRKISSVHCADLDSTCESGSDVEENNTGCPLYWANIKYGSSASHEQQRTASLICDYMLNIQPLWPVRVGMMVAIEFKMLVICITRTLLLQAFNVCWVLENCTFQNEVPEILKVITARHGWNTSLNWQKVLLKFPRGWARRCRWTGAIQTWET